MRFALTLGLAVGIGLGAAPAFAQTAVDTHKLEVKDVDFSFEGPFGTYDRGALQRGFQVYKEVCSACHGLNHIAFHNLDEDGGPGFDEAQAKAIAAGFKVPAGPDEQGNITDDKGNLLMRPGILADYVPSPFANEEAARAANSGNLPPDLSLIVKARDGGAQYVYSILTGFKEAPTPPKGFTVTKGKYYNPYFEGWNIGMPAPLADKSVDYSDGTKPTLDQEAHDVATFLAWASDPKMEERKRMGFAVILFLLALSGVLFLAYRKMWADQH
jgi:cytochrome c1